MNWLLENLLPIGDLMRGWSLRWCTQVSPGLNSFFLCQHQLLRQMMRRRKIMMKMTMTTLRLTHRFPDSCTGRSMDGDAVRCKLWNKCLSFAFKLKFLWFSPAQTWQSRQWEVQPPSCSWLRTGTLRCCRPAGKKEIFRHASVSSTHPCQFVGKLVGKSVGHTFEFPLPLNSEHFCATVVFDDPSAMLLGAHRHQGGRHHQQGVRHQT